MPGECAMAEAKRTMSITHDGIDFNESVCIQLCNQKYSCKQQL